MQKLINLFPPQYYINEQDLFNKFIYQCHFYYSGIIREPTIIPPTPTPSPPIPISKLPCVNEDVETDDDETTSLTTNGRNSSGERIQNELLGLQCDQTSWNTDSSVITYLN